MTDKITEKSGKSGAIVTYAIALVCLVAGLFVPLYGTADSLADKMLFMYLPDAVNVALGKSLISGSWVKTFTELYPLTIFGRYCNIFAWTLLLYALITVVGLFFLIPVLLGNKQKSTSIVCAYVIEVAALIDLTVYLIFALAVTSGEAWFNYSVLIAFGGTAIILIVQSIMNKKSLGVCKLFLFLLSLLAMITLYDVTLWITSLTTPLTNIADAIGLSVGFAEYAGISYFFGYTLNIEQLGTLLSYLEVKERILAIALTITATITIINFIIDVIGLSTLSRNDRDGYVKANKPSKVFALIRYLLEILAVVFAIIMLLVVKQRIGIYLYVLAIIALIQLIISIVRLCLVKGLQRKVKKAKQQAETANLMNTGIQPEASFYLDQPEDDTVYAVESEAYTQTIESVQPDVNAEPETTQEVEPHPTEPEAEQTTMDISEVEKVEPQPEPSVAPAPEVTNGEQMEIPVEEEPAPVKEETHTIVYNVKRVYNGPSDKFMDTLTEGEKIEFVKTFIEKSKGTLPRIPDYEIGGDNSEFFPAVFIYLGKIRGLISSGLLGKIYKQLNLMN